MSDSHSAPPAPSPGSSTSDRPGLSRRKAIVGGVVGAAGILALGSQQGVAGAPTESASSQGPTPRPTGARMPTVFLPHGGGPWPFVDLGFNQGFDGLIRYLKSVPQVPKTAPRAILVISAHWEEAVPTVMTAERPALYFDYYGFPPAAYQLTWPAPGDPALAARVRGLLAQSGFSTAEDPTRGFDHGTFVPLKVSYPEPTIPVVQLSLVKGLDPAEHLKLGRALAPLRDEGVFIVGSGMSYHNMRGFMQAGAGPTSDAFDSWLRETLTCAPAERDRRLSDWDDAPAARACHPREEHLLPLMVVAGAAGESVGQIAYNDVFMGVRLSAVHFG